MTNPDRIVAEGVKIAGRNAMVVPAKNSPIIKKDTPKRKRGPATIKTEGMEVFDIRKVGNKGSPKPKVVKRAPRKRTTSAALARANEDAPEPTSKYKSEEALKSAYEKALLQQSEGVQFSPRDLEAVASPKKSVGHGRQPAPRGRPAAGRLAATMQFEELEEPMALVELEKFALSIIPPRYRPASNEELQVGGPNGAMTFNDLIDGIANEYDCARDELLIVERTELDTLKEELAKSRKENDWLKKVHADLKSDWAGVVDENEGFRAQLDKYTGEAMIEESEDEQEMSRE